MSPDRARRLFAQARVARLATAGADGRPHLVPIVFALAAVGGHDVIYSVVDAKPKRTTALRRLRNVAANPLVSVLADHYDEDWTSLWWVRADGRARILGGDSADAEARDAIALLRARYPQQRAVGAVLAVDVQRFSGWSATG